VTKGGRMNSNTRSTELSWRGFDCFRKGRVTEANGPGGGEINHAALVQTSDIGLFPRLPHALLSAAVAPNRGERQQACREALHGIPRVDDIHGLCPIENLSADKIGNFRDKNGLPCKDSRGSVILWELSFLIAKYFVSLRLLGDIYLGISDLEETRMKEGNG